MVGIRNKASCVFAALLVLAALTGCKKSEPAPESQSGDTRQIAVADGPKLAKGVKLQAAGKPIDIEVGHLVPSACDWNNDGKKDLIVGQFAGGAIRLYLNEGTDAAPVFGEFSLLHAGGKPIKLDAG